ncbi:LysM peptidoglycan-binding domain-containing protein [Streptomyces luteolifulvus]|uniref:LysM peptidoglycan-binding domain-containing protein n=1 Tax=Streptomyces luteolifulvus TaxID=2615112 RepID=A0A6H9UQY5_9ACTN|nr:LysM peptidoglycan-binding domain-containing protein [Streptomyces luteolifulvus]KAB1141157.1 LysM peptidoglycan-binding domain-containing protein [Streptomyces luteolifulvus]
MAHRTIKPLRAAGALLRALTGLVLLIALVGGVPLALLTFGHQPTELSGGLNLLLEQDDGTLWLVALTCIGWAAWAAFTVSVVVEVVAVARRRSAPRIRVLGGMQSLASFLVGGIVLLAPTAASAATATPAVAVTQTVSGPNAAASATPTSTAAPNTDFPTHTVASATETPWDLAEEYLGNGQRWRDIAALNPDIPELAAGDKYLPTKAVIKLPLDARPSTPTANDGEGDRVSQADASAAAGGVRPQLGDSAPAADEKGAHVVTVHSGDYLSKIAEEELGDGNEWPRLFEASLGKPQPHGLPRIADPDVVYAGQQVTVPGARTDQRPRDGDRGEEPGSQETTPPATQSPDGTQTPGDGTGDAQPPAPSQTATPPSQSSAPSAPASRPAEQEQSSPSAAASATPEPSDSASASSPSASAEPSSSAASSPATDVPEVPATAPASSRLNLRIVLGAGALLAAAITGALALRRTLQRRRRKPGEKIAIASETSAAEAQLAAAAEPDGAARLDVALRTLAHHVAQQEDADTVLPRLRAARIGTRAVEVLPEDLDQEAVAPFTAGRGGWWVLSADAVLLDDEAARDVQAPYPGLVTIGSTKGGDLLLLNLAGLPALLLEGNPVHITEVCTSLALELGMSPWAAEVEVVTVGFGEDLPQLLPTTRIAHMRHATHALRDLTERLLEAHQMPETQHQPYLLLCASPLDEDTAWRFADDLIDRAGTVPVTLIAPASTAATHFPEAEILDASLGEAQHLDYADADITVQRLEHAAYLQITTALKVSGQPPHPAEGPWQDVPDELDSMQETEQAQPEEPTMPAAAASIPSPAAAPDVSGEVFPALLTASTDPSGLRLPTTSSTGLEDETRPATEAAVSSAPASPAADFTDAAESAEGDGPGAAVEEPAVPELEECEAQDLHAPEIRVLGPVEVTGVDSTGHGPRMAQLAALLFFRPGRSADAVCSDMDPASPWGLSTLNARMQGLRRSLGSDLAGNPYVPRRKSGEDPYRLSPGVRCDWSRFLQLVEHALPLGPSGLPELEKALTLVRGKPFGGTPPPWAEPYQQEMITRIIDVAHTVATYRTPAGPHHDLSAARQAVATGLDVDDTAELLYRAWCRLEYAAGNRQGLHTAITRVQQVNRTLDCSLEIETEQLINELLNRSGPAVRM